MSALRTAFIALGITVAALLAHDGVRWAVTPSVRVWEMTESQAQAVATFVAADNTPNVKMVITVVPGAPHDAVVEAYRLMWAVQRGKRWQVSVEPFEAYDSPLETGMLIGTPLGKDDVAATAQASISMMIFKTKLGSFQPRVRPDADKGTVVVTIGAHP